MTRKRWAVILLIVSATVVLPASAAAASFSDGTYRVGKDIPAGTYRAPGGEGCYWERLRNFSGTLGGIIANDLAMGPVVVTISRTDKGFSTHDCGTWTSRVRRITKSMTRFGDGTFIVGLDIRPGTYRARGGSGCYWARLRSFGGQTSEIIANGLPTGPSLVTISRSDRGFTSHSCGDWFRV